MRYLGRGLLLMLTLAILAWSLDSLGTRQPTLWPGLWGKAAPDYRRDFDAARSRTVYALDESRWLNIPLPARVRELKVITNANLPASKHLPIDLMWSYALHYQLLDASGAVLREHTHSHRTRLSRYRDTARKTLTTAGFYATGPLVPTDTRVLALTLLTTPAATQLRLRLSSKDAPLVGVSVRLAAREPTTSSQTDYQWRRLNDTQKRSLVNGLIYPVAFLHQREKDYLSIKRWIPLGPQGVEGRDYHARKLYVIDTLDYIAERSPILPAGLVINPTQYGVIPLPLQGLEMRLDMHSLGAAFQSPPPERIDLIWYGDDPTERETFTLSWSDPAIHFERFFRGGLLEVRVANGTMLVRPYELVGTQLHGLQITPRYLRTYQVQAEQPLVYEVSHIDPLPTPWRIDVRHLIEPLAAAPTPPVLGYAFLTAAGTVIKRGQLHSIAPVSHYDRATPSTHTAVPSEATPFYFSLPSNVARLQFFRLPDSDNAPLLVAAFNRPPDLVRDTRAPAAHSWFPSEQVPNPQWAWFPIRPRQHAALIREHHSVLLTLQPRPPDVSDAATSELYRWDDYHPEGAWQARHLLLPYDPEKPVRAEALAVVYRPLPANRTVHLPFRSSYGLSIVKPQLIVLGQDNDPVAFRLLIDGKEHTAGTIAGRRTTIQLPDFQVGRRRVRLQAEPAAGSWFINYAGAGSGALLKRLANRFDGDGLRFIYHRGSAVDETLSMRFYAPYGATQPSHLYVRLDAARPASLEPAATWTFTERRYVVHPSPGPPAPVLNTPTGAANPGQAFFLPIGRDVPVGRYQLYCRVESGPKGYLTVAKLTPGTFKQRVFIREQVDHDIPAIP